MSNNFDFSQFRIISPELANFSTSEIRISTTSISFNIASAAELKYPQRVCLLASDDGTMLGIKAFDGNSFDEMAIPFYDREKKYNKCHRIIIQDRNFVKALRAELGWTDKASRKAYGVCYGKEGLLLFNLCTAVFLSDRSLATKKPSLRNYPTLQEALSTMRPQMLALPPAG